MIVDFEKAEKVVRSNRGWRVRNNGCWYKILWNDKINNYTIERLG